LDFGVRAPSEQGHEVGFVVVDHDDLCGILAIKILKFSGFVGVV
jgi:hypothetical protein